MPTEVVALVSLLLAGTQTLVVLIGVPIAVGQLRASSKARELEAFAGVFDNITSEKRTVRIAHVLHLSDDSETWSREDRQAAEAERASFEYVGFLVHQGFIRRRLVLYMYSLLIVNMWEKLAPWTRELRATMETPNLASSFEWLAGEAGRYRKRRRLPLTGSARVLYGDPSLSAVISVAPGSEGADEQTQEPRSPQARRFLAWLPWRRAM